MREIEFRAWNGDKMLTNIIVIDSTEVIDCDCISHKLDDGVSDVQSVMQYTGLKDKNGKKI